jgi:hypothetical protein
MRKLYESVRRMLRRKVSYGRNVSEVKELYRALVEKWETLPRGWTKESLRKFWNTLTGNTPAGEGGVRKCIAKIKRAYPAITDPEAFCASAADVLFPMWRQKAAEERRKRKKRKRSK